MIEIKANNGAIEQTAQGSSMDLFVEATAIVHALWKMIGDTHGGGFLAPMFKESLMTEGFWQLHALSSEKPEGEQNEDVKEDETV